MLMSSGFVSRTIFKFIIVYLLDKRVFYVIINVVLFFTEDAKMGLVFDIQRNSSVDGPGIRTTVFFKGCNLRCAWCHNPEGQSFEKQTLQYKDRTTECGTEMCAEEIVKVILKDKAFYDVSGGGATFSGGECMLQPELLCECLKLCRENGIHTAVDTAGCVPWESFEKVMPYTDMFLYDVKLADDTLHQKWTGTSNKLIFENLKKLSESFFGEIIIRIPVVGTVNNNDAEMQKIAEMLKSINHTQVELLPYHSMGNHKYFALGGAAVEFSVPNKENIERYGMLFN